MGIPGLKIGAAASPDAAYGMTKSMIRDNGPCFLFLLEDLAVKEAELLLALLRLLRRRLLP